MPAVQLVSEEEVYRPEDWRQYVASPTSAIEYTGFWSPDGEALQRTTIRPTPGRPGPYGEPGVGVHDATNIYSRRSIDHSNLQLCSNSHRP